MNVLVVGLNHQLQPCQIRSAGDQIVSLETDQKVQFANTLERLIRQRYVQFVGEEAEHGVEMIAAKVSRDLGCGYANIEMHPSERERRRIPTDYTDSRKPYTSEQRAAWHQERETHMAQTAIAQAGQVNNMLILCGREHTEALSACFRNAHHHVDQYDLNRESWYVEDWLQYVLQTD